MTEPPTLSSSQPFPAPLPLPAGYHRHEPSVGELRAAINACVRGRDWAALSWSELVEGLLALGRTDISLARLAEGHIDGMRILAQADHEPQTDALYGVWASRSRRTGIAAIPDDEGLTLDGTVRFASGAGVIDRALIPVWLDEDHHQLVDVSIAGLRIDTAAWITAAMEISRSHTVIINGLRIRADDHVGLPDFYLDRPGFFPGGVGVAACWVGGAARIADLLLQRPAASWSPAQQVRLGRIRTQLTAAAAVVRSTAAALDALWAASEAPWQAIATEARAAVGDAVGAILEDSRRIAGAAGLAHDEDLSRAHHDLDLYVLQQNTDGDRGYLGGLYLR